MLRCCLFSSLIYSYKENSKGKQVSVPECPLTNAQSGAELFHRHIQIKLNFSAYKTAGWKTTEKEKNNSGARC